MYKIRSSVKALILHDDQILTIQKESGGNNKYVLPGGGQNFNENLSDAVVRECLEEIGMKVTVGALLWVREYISKNHVPAQPEIEQAHIVEHIFEVFLKTIPDSFSPLEADSTQIGVVWLPIAKLTDYNFFPREFISLIQQKIEGKEPDQVYIGDKN